MCISTAHDTYPALAPLLATTCDFVIYHKDLNGAGPLGALNKALTDSPRSTR
jgi:hypothetical protein